MSVRRLAREQPASFAFTPESLEKAHWWIAKFPAGRQQSAVIALLWLVQKQEGWVPEPALRVVADLLGMAVIRVLECVTFYTMFQLEPVGSVAHFQVCGTPPKGSAIGRQATAPVGGPLTLTDPTLYDGSRAEPYKLPNAPEPA